MSVPAHARTVRNEGPPLDQWFTRPELAGPLVDWALRRGDVESVLEPCAGRGDIARWVPPTKKLTCVEVDPDVAQQCRERIPRAHVVTGDLLEVVEEMATHDLAVTNPAFTYVSNLDAKLLACAMLLSDRLVALVRTAFFGNVGAEREFWRAPRLSEPIVLVGRVDLVGRPCFDRSDAPELDGTGGTPLSDFAIGEWARAADAHRFPFEYDRWLL